MPSPSGYCYSTKNELKFIDKIGTFSQRPKKNKIECLQGYLEGALKRTDWGTMDKDRIISYAYNTYKNLSKDLGYEN